MSPPVVTPHALVVVLVVLLATTAGLVVALLGVRLVRRARGRLRDRRLARTRPDLLLLLAGEPDEVEQARQTLIHLPRRDRAALQPSLVGLLAKVRGQSRTAVIDVLTQHGAVTAARRRLRTGTPTGRAAAAQLLGLAGVTDSAPALLRMLGNRDADVRLAVVRALGHLGVGQAAGPLLRLAGDPRDVPIPVLTAALARIDDVPEQDLVRVLTYGSARQRSLAAEVSGIRQALGCAGVLQQRLHDDFDTDVRIRCARALGRLGLPRALADLVTATDADQPAALRAVATRALGAIGHRDAVEPLRRLCVDADDRVAVNAAAALLGCGPEGNTALTELAARPEGAHAREAQQVAALRGRLAVTTGPR